MKHLAIIGLVIPEPASTAAGKRMMQLLQIFEEWGYKVTFLTAAQNVEFSEKIEVQKIKLNDSSFDALLRNLNPDVVLFDRFHTEEQFGWRVSQTCPNAIRILDTEDLHFLRKGRETAFKNGRTANNSDFINNVFKREIASILRCDLSLIISTFEMKLLIEHYTINESILFYLPLFAEINPSAIPFSERKNFISIGNFLHEPNWQTVLLLKKYWKDIRKNLPEGELHVFGAYASEKVHQLHSEKEGFLIKGRAESVEKLFHSARVLLAPIPYGAGIKGKLLESMQFGLPNVTTPAGAEAMGDPSEWNGYITDHDEEFIARAVQLYQNKDHYNECIQKGFKLIQNRFSKKDFLSTFKSKIHILSANLNEHREKNYLGLVLQHHTMNSSKFMSKWIEEKNKNGT